MYVSFVRETFALQQTIVNKANCTESNPNADTVCPVNGSGDGIDSPQRVLFPPERLNLKWNQVHRIGAGLQNMGNTCFLNSALQCLTYTPPFANYMLTREHSKSCKCWVLPYFTKYYCNIDLINLSCLHFLKYFPTYSCCRFRARVLYDVHHAKPHHSGFCQLWECHQAHRCA